MSPATKASPWHQLLDKKLSRRGVMQSAAALGAAHLLVGARAGETVNNGAPSADVGPAQRFYQPFTPIAPTTADTITLPPGYSFQLLAPWGETFTEAGEEIGFNHDFVGYFPIDLLERGTSSEDALLTINHEYPNALFVGGDVENRSSEQLEAEMRSVGVSVVRVRREAEGWRLVMDPHDRKIDAFTPMMLTGPVRGSSVVGGATEVRGTVGNCSGSQTPWGTLLTCEENVDGYQEAWAGTGYEAIHQGWVTEIDPFDPASTPKKRTAMGRFRHENAALVIAPDYRLLLWNLLRRYDRGQDDFSRVYDMIRRARSDCQEGFARSAGALFVSRLKQRDVWEELQRTPKYRVGVMQLAA